MKKLPLTVQNCLRDYQTLLNETFPGMVKGIYLHGSLALDAFVPGKSDVDFLTVINREFSNKDLERLSSLHRTIEQKYDESRLDGGYMKWEGFDETFSTLRAPYYNDGELHLSPFYNPIIGWILQSQGITITGPAIHSLPLSITSQQLNAYVVQNMSDYWAVRTKKLEMSKEQLLELRDDEIDAEIEWSVLGVLRQYYTLQEHKIISKAGAGKYGLKHLHEKWHPIINHALNGRSTSSYVQNLPKDERISYLISFSMELIQSCEGQIN